MPFLEIIIERTVDRVGQVLERFRNTKRIYIYGAGRVGKSSFLDKLTKTKRTTIQIQKDNYEPTPADEGRVYKNAGSEIGSDYVDVIIRFYSYGGQMKNPELINSRKKDFNQVKPDAVIFIASPVILERSWDKDSAYPYNEVIAQNKASLKELHDILSTNSTTAKNCDVIVPVVSHKDEWDGENHFKEKFTKEFEEEIIDLATIDGINVIPWMAYSIHDRAEIILVVEKVLEELGIDGSPLRGLLGI